MTIFETIKNNNILKIGLIVAVIYIVYRYYNKESLENTVLVQPELTNTVQQTVVPMTQGDEQMELNEIVDGQTQLTTEDLLPKYDAANAFTQENPVSKLLKSNSYLQSGYHQGINTVVQSHKISYLDLRSCPPIPKNDNLTPFNNSSYDTPMGFGRKKLE